MRIFGFASKHVDERRVSVPNRARLTRPINLANSNNFQQL